MCVDWSFELVPWFDLVLANHMANVVHLFIHFNQMAVIKRFGGSAQVGCHWLFIAICVI